MVLITVRINFKHKQVFFGAIQLYALFAKRKYGFVFKKATKKLRYEQNIFFKVEAGFETAEWEWNIW